MFFSGEAVSAESLGPLDLGFAGDLSWRGAGQRLALEQGRLTLPGGAAVAIDAAIGLSRGLPFSLVVKAGDLDFLRTVSALPAALALPPAAPRPSGTLDLGASLSGSLLDPEAWQLVDATLDLSRMREAARREAHRVPLLEPFVQRAEEEQGPRARSWSARRTRTSCPSPSCPATPCAR